MAYAQLTFAEKNYIDMRLKYHDSISSNIK